MFGKAKKAKGSYGIVGLGRFGMALAIELAEAGEDLVVLDQDEEKVRALRDYTEAAYVVKALDKKTLEETGIQNCDVAVVCIGEKMDVSILTTLHLVSMGIPTVIAKAASEEQGQVLRKLGAQAEIKGYSLVPGGVYFKNGWAQLKLGVAKGKHLFDKRQALKKRDLNREMEKNFKNNIRF